MIEYRHMETGDEPRVRALTKRCHPTWPSRPKFWYHANPTIIAIENGAVIGYGCYTVDNHPAGNSFIMYLRDSGVAEEHRGRGLGRTLLEKRMAVGGYLGIGMFVGCTAPSNKPMRKILTSLGFHSCQRVPQYFAFNDPPEDGLIFIHAGDHHDD